VVTLGSCFAQHIARHLAKSGCTYFVPEQAPADMTAAEAEQRQYGVFSARYGNVYTVRQALQLFDRAFGRFEPTEAVWERDGTWVDPFRPQIEPDGFADIPTLQASRREHLRHVRAAFTQARWLIFTLGLTEAWRARADGAVFPLAPGVAGGAFDPERHEFVNFSAAEVRDDLFAFIERVRSVNPGAGVVLTVSPVPLAATYEKRHVWVSTTFSKAALRVAADEAERAYAHVSYFPSYEVITSPATSGAYYADDLRQVTEGGVCQVMRLFSAHCLGEGSVALAASAGSAPAATTSAGDAARFQADVVCEEEAIERSLQQGRLA
jgi:hypothetical protein